MSSVGEISRTENLQSFLHTHSLVLPVYCCLLFFFFSHSKSSELLVMTVTRYYSNNLVHLLIYSAQLKNYRFSGFPDTFGPLPPSLPPFLYFLSFFHDISILKSPEQSSVFSFKFYRHIQPQSNSAAFMIMSQYKEVGLQKVEYPRGNTTYVVSLFPVQASLHCNDL